MLTPARVRRMAPALAVIGITALAQPAGGSVGHPPPRDTVASPARPATVQPADRLPAAAPPADARPAAAPPAAAPPADARPAEPGSHPGRLDLLLASQRAAGLSCASTARGTPVCTPPTAQGGSVAAASGTTDTPRGGSLVCYGDGTTGPRVRAVYARPQSGPDRYTASLPSIRDWAAGINRQFDASAARTGGRRFVRFATSPGSTCNLLVLNVVLPDSAFTSFQATVDALQAKGLAADWSKYLVWSDASGVCGVGSLYADDSAGPANLNNSSMPSYARVDRACWGRVEAHELVHMLGGVQPSAPNATAGYHCSDGADDLCYDDGSRGGRQRQVCSPQRVPVLDCRNDDYFSTAPARGSYLDTHWNVARSSYLATSMNDPGPPAQPRPTPSGGPTPSPSPSSGPSGLVPALPAPPVTVSPLPSLIPVPGP